MLNITHKKSKDGTKTYAEIGSISTMPKGFPCPNQINPSFVWTYEDFDIEKFNALPVFLKAKMVNSLEYKQSISGGQEIEVNDPQVESRQDEDLPF
jgi:hypothetical protein